MKYDYIISVVMPIYNTAKYLRAAIDSIINQDIGFEENIQLILVNNASTDNADEICKKYLDMYPNNIEYVHLDENVRISGARNAGKKLVRGKYVNFFDSDDIWGASCFSVGIDLLEQHANEIDFVGFRVKNFGKQTDYHFLDYKFTGDRIIDAWIEYDAIQLQATSTIIKSDVALSLDFDEKLHVSSEDSKYLAELLIPKMKYGVISSQEYRYRRRKNSGMATAHLDSNYYLPVMHEYLGYISSLAKKTFGVLPQHFQYHLMYTLSWRLKETDYGVLDENSKNEYLSLIKSFLVMVDDYIILGMSNLSKERKFLALTLKYGDYEINNVSVWKTDVIYKNRRLFDITHRGNFLINKIEGDGSNLTVTGTMSLLPHMDDYTVFLISANGEVYTFTEDVELCKNVYWYNYIVASKKCLEVTIPKDVFVGSILMLKYKQVEYQIPFNLEKIESVEVKTITRYSLLENKSIVLSDNELTVEELNE